VAKRKLFTSKEISLLKALKKGSIPFLIVGLSAASLQGAPVATQDIDLWFKDLSDEKLHRTLRKAGGFYVPPFGLNPPQIGGEDFELIDLVLRMDGLKSFDYEYKRSKKVKLGSLTLRILPLDRIIKSKKATGRKKDKASLPVLEDVLKTIKAEQK
jgi:hypothetical protein